MCYRVEKLAHTNRRTRTNGRTEVTTIPTGFYGQWLIMKKCHGHGRYHRLCPGKESLDIFYVARVFSWHFLMNICFVSSMWQWLNPIPFIFSVSISTLHKANYERRKMILSMHRLTLWYAMQDFSLPLVSVWKIAPDHKQHALLLSEDNVSCHISQKTKRCADWFRKSSKID